MKIQNMEEMKEIQKKQYAVKRSYPTFFTVQDLKELGLSQKEFADSLNLSYNYFNQIINGYVNFNEDEYKKAQEIVEAAKNKLIEKYSAK